MPSSGVLDYDLTVYSLLAYISVIADSSDKDSDRRQKKSNIESKVTLQILSTVDSTGTNIGVISGRAIT